MKTICQRYERLKAISSGEHLFGDELAKESWQIGPVEEAK